MKIPPFDTPVSIHRFRSKNDGFDLPLNIFMWCWVNALNLGIWCFAAAAIARAIKFGLQ